MSKRILTSVLVIGLVAALAGVGTFALFTDTASSTGNLVGAGTLDLKVDGEDTVVPMSISGVAPGDSGWAYHYQWYLTTNDGSVPAGRLTFKIDNVQHDGGAFPAPEQAVDPDNSGDLADNVLVTVQFPDWDTPVGTYTLAELEQGITITDDFEAAMTSGDAGVEFDVDIPAGAGNEIMGDSVTFDGHFTLEQAAE